MVRRVRGVVVGLVLGIAVAGGGCDGDSGGGFSTTVPGDKSIADLTPAERDKLCADITTWAMGPFLTDGCNGSAWLATFLLAGLDTTATDAALRASCEGLYNDCVAGGVTGMCDVSATCTATVSEYSMCLTDSAAVLSGLPACSTVTRASLETNVAELLSQPASAACMSLEMKCPDAT